jgi:hypothetical protein
MVTMAGMLISATHCACGSSRGMTRDTSVSSHVARREVSSDSPIAKAWGAGVRTEVEDGWEERM